jgi:hypothetical protein
MLGPGVAGHGPMALILSENFTLRLLCLPVAINRPENAFHILVVNALRKTPNASRASAAAMDPYTGYICTHASLGLSYAGNYFYLYQIHFNQD